MTRWLLLPLLALVALAITGFLRTAPLPFPTPSQQELVVLTQAGPLTYDDDDPAQIGGFEHDLAELFGEELGVAVRFITAAQEDFPDLIGANKAHFAAAWLSPDVLPATLHISTAFLRSRDVLVQHEASLPIDEEADLAGKTVHVLAGSRQAKTLAALQNKINGLRVVEVEKSTAGELLESVATRKIELAVVDEAMFDVALAVAPALQANLYLGGEHAIAWLFPERANPELVARANDFIARIQKTPAFLRLKERYFGHIHRLDHEDISNMVELSKTALPKLQPLFEEAQTITGIDWRLLAALAYQESRWNPLATSPTGVRGIMMLTEETADRMSVSNRLDARASILAGARYLETLRNLVPAGTPEPDRTWLALAAYNIGPGHFNAALTIARQLQADTTAWHTMKSILPLLAKPQYYKHLKSGRARGGEAVILVENVRSFYAILSHSQGRRGGPAGLALGPRIDEPDQTGFSFSIPPI